MSQQLIKVVFVALMAAPAVARAIPIPEFSLQVPLAFALDPSLASPPPLPRSNVIIEKSQTLTLGSFAQNGDIAGGDAALVLFIRDPSPLLQSVALHSNPTIAVNSSISSAWDVILAGTTAGDAVPGDFKIGFFEFEIQFVAGSNVGDHGFFDVGLALLGDEHQSIFDAPGVEYTMDVFLGTTNLDNGVKFPQSTIGGASGFDFSVPEPGALPMTSIGLLILIISRSTWKRETKKPEGHVRQSLN